MTDKNNKKIKGEDCSKYTNYDICLNGKVEGLAKTRVSYWNLIRAYLLLYSKDKFLCFVANGMDDNLDFLHYSKCVEFESEKTLNDFYQDNVEQSVVIRAINGNVID